MNADRARALAQRLIAKGAVASWTRRSLVSGGASGVVQETAPPQTFALPAAQVSPEDVALGGEWWANSTLVLVLAAVSMPFDPDAATGEPGVHFEDTVRWAGRDYRVQASRSWFAAGADGQPRPYAHFVALVG